jgi:predicted ATPase
MKFGAVQSSGLALERTGENVFPLLRNWRDNSDTEAKFDFVISTLREAFPHVSKVDFEQAGQTVTMAIRDRRWADRKLPISRESTGLVTALLQLCAVASCRPHSLVTIDELETSLHPHAIRVLIAAFRRWAKEYNLRIVLATQSETVLDQFHDDPGQIYVIEPGQEVTPRSLTEMFDGEYLNQFSLGDLFSHLEFGSNRESPTSP